jgi:hypothetical protein
MATGGGVATGGGTATGGGAATGGGSATGGGIATGGGTATGGGSGTGGGTALPDAGLCAPVCAVDLDCQSTCAPPTAGDSNCCDVPSGTCFVSAGAVCPMSTTDGGMGPY